MRSLRHVLIGFGIAGYISLALFGLLAVPAHGADHGAHYADACPFVIGEQSLCSMGPIEHVRAWQNATTTLVSTGLFVLIPLFFLYFYRIPVPPMPRCHVRKKLFREALLTRLFSQGILHSKAY